MNTRSGETFNQVVASPNLVRPTIPQKQDVRKDYDMKKPKFKVDKHILTPKHVKISEKDKAQLFEKYRVTSKEMPKILKTDSAIKELEPKPGDIIKIIRKSATAGESHFYRVVADV